MEGGREGGGGGSRGCVGCLLAIQISGSLHFQLTFAASQRKREDRGKKTDESAVADCQHSQLSGQSYLTNIWHVPFTCSELNAV